MFLFRNLYPMILIIKATINVRKRSDSIDQLGVTIFLYCQLGRYQSFSTIEQPKLCQHYKNNKLIKLTKSLFNNSRNLLLVVV